MIRRIESLESTELFLRGSHYSREILSHMQTYGTEYDFCELYELCGRSRRVGVLCTMNGSLTADIMENSQISSTLLREVQEFVGFKSPYSVQLCSELSPRTGIAGYKRMKRNFYKVLPGDNNSGIDSDPDPETVFVTAFPDSDSSYGLWLTDTVRRRNKGLLRLYSYNTSVLTVRFFLSGMAYICDVATPEKDRGKGYARTLLSKVSYELKKQGYESYISSEEDRWTFYDELGYEKLGSDVIYKLRNGDRN